MLLLLPDVPKPLRLRLSEERSGECARNSGEKTPAARSNESIDGSSRPPISRPRLADWDAASPF